MLNGCCCRLQVLAAAWLGEYNTLGSEVKACGSGRYGVGLSGSLAVGLKPHKRAPVPALDGP